MRYSHASVFITSRLRNLRQAIMLLCLLICMYVCDAKLLFELLLYNTIIYYCSYKARNHLLRLIVEKWKFHENRIIMWVD